MGKTIIVATKNQGKVKEIQEILLDLQFNVISMQQAGIGLEIEETGKTFTENALIKARAIYDITGETVMSDDSGLEIDFLNGLPGIYSARFAGEGASDAEKNNKILALMYGISEEFRKARFVCAIGMIFSDGAEISVRGICEGRIGCKMEGSNGFGYDPLFYVPEYNKTVAQMDSSLKNMISHRGRALVLLKEKIQGI